MQELIARDADGSADQFASLVGLVPDTVRSYLHGQRAPNARALYEIWRHTEISPTYLLTGEGDERVKARKQQLRLWAPEVLAGCESTVYAENAFVKYALGPAPGQKVEQSADSSGIEVLTIHWEFRRPPAPPPAPPEGSPYGSASHAEAGLLALLASHDDLSGGHDWRARRGIEFMAHASAPNTPLLFKIKAGTEKGIAEGFTQFILGPEPQTCVFDFDHLRWLNLDWSHVRLVAISSTCDRGCDSSFEAHLRDLRFLDP